MSLAYLLDTNIVIALLRGATPPTRQRFRDAEGRIAVSVITAMELEYGAERSSDPCGNRRSVEELLSLVEVLPFDRAAAENAGRLRAKLAAQGTPIGPFDSLIAGHARSRGLVVVTNNTREFDRVPGLQVEDWL
ncbi:MAG: type II toxin-antitoxin system VapC family toxin [Propionibacteriaceae bacterium]|nr:type II toxin-antitoxin system VapC family toxin [Propionibacteriaceae bacterium]